MNKAQRNINVLMLLLFSAYAIYSIIYEKPSLFFIIYLFWFDEVIRNISLYIQIKSYKENPAINNEFTKQTAIGFIRTRFFFLFVYAVFIVIAFGIFFHLGKEDRDVLVRNVQILVFRDFAFNICIMLAIVREIIQIKTTALKKFATIPQFNPMSGHLLTLHLSIILGAFLWALTSGKFDGFSFTLGPFNRYAIILPFFVIKFWVDLYQINQSKPAINLSAPSL